MPTETPLLEIDTLGKRFPGVVALDGVSLSLRAGEVHGLIGQNGAGKSTLINILSGMLTPDAGAIRLDGAPVAVRNPRHALSLGIATVYQELSLLPNLTVAQNVSLGREPTKGGLLDIRTSRTHAAETLARLGLDFSPDVLVSNLSLAQRQMVEIAKALASHPKILILDEPTASLGQRESQKLFDAIGRLKAEGVAVVYVSHRFAEVLALCDVATVLRNGRHVVSTSLAGWSEARLTDAMIGAQTASYVPSKRTAGDVVLSVRDLTYMQRVHETSFALRRGEILALTGLLGAGQNEIARILGGDLRPESGSIVKDGRPLPWSGPYGATTAGVALLTDERKHEGILPNLTLRENIGIASLADRRATAGIVETTKERELTGKAISDYGIAASSTEVAMRTLSGGNQQKALLARWDLADADVLVLIEPTRGVDVGARADIYRRLDTLARSGKSIVVVSSDLPEVLALADRILVLRNGVIVEETTPSEVDEEALNLMIQGAAAA
ncbi:MAG: sugar ABC transporter ATP-binding protein [Mesorhizobium sp.]|nr:sugar ABC transporter ATP-binding protein [Mesorhizobium sp.]MBL8580326.1 sugar ABC transporter ATP-binding protein [Mesorhizobium sp.]